LPWCVTSWRIFERTLPERGSIFAIKSDQLVVANRRGSTMPAAFKLVSRASSKALTAVSLPEPSLITQLPVNQEYDRVQSWTLQPWDLAGDFAIRSLTSPELALGLDPTDSRRLFVGPVDNAQVWRITPIAHPPYFFLIEGPDDLLIDVPHGSHADNLGIQVFRRNEHANQQWVLLPVLTELG
jgi:hypothetical protein